ncbi:PAS domain S-box protein [Methanospirillum stamsii]|uniref:histidine kinase n=1 Tax=Methanospirillum stamsii TaxID=1277351 RepID=A0A2V2NJY4_9EURY|nr:PAS domain S-box protein [Methanospirillum stamsii]PWR75653.1 hypothetical protein DLD82_03460 [Methanospirillum stamsii]
MKTRHFFIDRSSLISRFTALLLVILIISIISITTLWYIDEKNRIEKQFVLEQNHTEQIMHKSVRWIDAGIMLYDYSFEPALKNAMNIFLESYESSNRDVRKMNISQLQQTFNASFGGTWDLYIINADGIVEKTTFPQDIGLDFSKYPTFFKTLSRIRENNEYVVDRTVKGFAKDAPSRKFAYQGTPDGRYILEISRNFQKFIPHESEISYAELLNSLPQLHIDIKSVELYNNKGEMVSEWNDQGVPENISHDIQKNIISLLAKKENTYIDDDKNNTKYSYLYLPIYDTTHPSSPMMNLEARVVYSTERIKKEIVETTLIYIIILFITLLAAFVIVWKTFIFFSYPVKNLISDINQITKGDLDHHIRKSNIQELEQIELSINSLVITLKDKILTLRKQEEQLQEELKNRQKAEEHIRDLLTEVQEKERQVQESEKRYRSVVETQKEFICRFSPDGTHLFVNDAYCRFFGKNPDEILGSLFTPDIPKEEKGDVARHFASLTPEHPMHLNEHHIILPDGSVRFVQWIDQAIFSKEGIITEYQSVGRDLTELKRLEKSLHASDALYRMTVNAMEDGVFVTNRDHTIIICNEWRKGRETGLHTITNNPVGKNLFEILIHMTEKDHQDYELVFSEGKMIVSEDIIEKENPVFIETRKIPIISDEPVSTVVTIIRDITAQKEAEIALTQLNQNLEQVVEQRTADLKASLDEMDAFAYSVSHDLRAPVRAIDGFSHLLLMKTDGDSNEECKYLISRIREGVMTMDRLIQDLLRFSRTARQPLQVMSIDMSGLVKSVITELTSQPGMKDISVTIENLHPAKGDVGLIRQVWYNLISNSIKFTSEQQTPVITIGSYEKEKEIIYYIKDQGIGFDMQYADKVFEVFSRLDPTQDIEGTGVGLALVKRIILRHHGRIWVQSGEGRGTTFYFTLQGKDGTDR